MSVLSICLWDMRFLVKLAGVLYLTTVWFYKDLISLPVLLLLLLLLLPLQPPPLLLFLIHFCAFCLVWFNVPYIFPQCQQSNAFMLLDCFIISLEDYGQLIVQSFGYIIFLFLLFDCCDFM